MIPDQLQYFLDDFWNFQNVHQIWTCGPRIYHQKTTKNIRKFMESSLKVLFLHIWTSCLVNFGKDGHRKMMKICLIKSAET